MFSESIVQKGGRRFLNALAYYGWKRRPRKLLSSLINATIKLLMEIPSLREGYIIGSIDELKKVKGLSMRKYILLSKNYNISNDVARLMLMMFRSFGLLTYLKVANRYKIIITELGEVMREFLKEVKLSNVEKFSLIFIPGLLFKTKARIITIAVLAGNKNLADLYSSIKARLFEGKLSDIERAAIEILDEIRLINGGRITDYITETQVALSILSFLGLINLISPSKFNINSQGKVISPSIFLGLNYELTKGDLLSFRVDVESLGITRVNEVYQKLGIYGNYLSSLMDNLKKARQRIEVDLRRYFGLPYRII